MPSAEIFIISSDDPPRSPLAGPPSDRSICIISSSPPRETPPGKGKGREVPSWESPVRWRVEENVAGLDRDHSEDSSRDRKSTNKGRRQPKGKEKGKAKAKTPDSDILSPINFTTFSPDLPDFRARSASITLNPIDQNRSPSPTESIKSHQIEEATTTAYQKNTVWISDLSSEIGDTQLATSTTATRRRTTRQSVQESHSAVGFSTPTTKLLAELYRMPVFGKDGDKNLSRSLSPVAGVCPNSPPKVTVRSKKRPSGGDKNMDEFGKPPSRCKRKKSTTVTDEQRVASPKRKGTGSKLQGEEKERMRREKEEEKERKRFLGEEEKERRKREKELKALEKQKETELTTVNKLKASKKESVPEMIVDMSQSFSETPSGLQLIRFLEPQGCDITQNWESPVPNAIKWRRKVRAEWNELLGYFVPIPEEIRPERHILVVIKADEFASLAIGKTDLAGHVRTLKRALGESSSTKLIYIIEGLTALRRKSRNAKSRSFQGAVRQAVAGEEGGVVAVATTTTRSRNRATRSAIVDEDALDNALLSLQVIYDCLVHETVNSMDTSEWISIFTGDISTIPYKLSRMNFTTSFCTEVGQVKTGVDTQDTYIKMLQEINRVTVGVANSVVAEYPTVRALVEGFRKKGEGMLADLEIMATKAGVGSGRPIGQATSKRVYKIFMGEDPDCMEF